MVKKRGNRLLLLLTPLVLFACAEQGAPEGEEELTPADSVMMTACECADCQDPEACTCCPEMINE